MQQRLFKAAVPMPLQIVIDDVGWRDGEDGHLRQEPYRTGIARQHVPEDYAAIISLGRQLGMKPQAAFILCEWDIHNRLRDLPHSTWMGADWDNSSRVGTWMDEAAAIMQNGREHVELTLHGIGHEFWENDTFTRAEWHSREGVMRPAEEVRAHVEMFARLLEDHAGLGKMPASFVPCAFLHRFGGDANLAKILREYGVDFISTPFQSMHGREQTQYDLFGFDHGVMTVDRGRDLFNWPVIDPPFSEIQQIDSPICGMHWPNILHPDPTRNEEVVSRWVTYLQSYQDRLDRILAGNVNMFRTQLAHHVCSKIQQRGNEITIDFSGVDCLPAPPQYFEKEVIIKISSSQSLRFSSADLDINPVSHKTIQHQQLYIVELRRRSQDKTVRIEVGVL